MTDDPLKWFDNLMAWDLEKGFMQSEIRARLQSMQALIASLEAQRLHSAEDWAETDTAIREAARTVLGDMVDGDTYGVPCLEDVVVDLVAKIHDLERELSLFQHATGA